MFKSTLILSDFLQIPMGFEWYEGAYWPYHISEWLVPNRCQTLANSTDFRELSTSECTLRHDILSSLLGRICSRNISPAEVEEKLGISHCNIIHDPFETSPRVIQDLNDCASSCYSSNLLPEVAHIHHSKTLNIGVHFRLGDIHLDGEHAFCDLKPIGPIVRVLDSSSTLDVRSISFRDVVEFLSNIDAEGCQIRLKLYAMGVEEVNGLPFPYELVSTGDDRRDFLDYVSNDIMIQGHSSFSVLAAFATGKQKVVVTSSTQSAKYAQHFNSVVSVLHPSDKFTINCPFLSVGSNFAHDS